MAQKDGALREKSSTERIREFDIRAEATLTAQSANAVAAIAAERRTRALQFVNRDTVRRSSWRVSFDEAGLPKSVFRDGGALTEPSAEQPEFIAREFLRRHSGLFSLRTPEIDALRLIRKSQTSGIVHLQFKQTLRGVDVFEGLVRVNLDQQGRVIESGVGSVVPGLDVDTTPRMQPEQAVRAAYGMLNLALPETLAQLEDAQGNLRRFANPATGLTPLSSELCFFPRTPTDPVLAYRLLLEVDANGWYEMVLDAATGRLLFVQNLYRFASGRIWRESPAKGTRDLVEFPDAWFTGTATTGNNVDAYLDSNGDNNPDSVNNTNMVGGRANNSTMVFDFPFGDRTTTQSPIMFQPAAVTNLFYLTNLAHDFFYGLGFDEASGNFQKSNSGLGGEENDPVKAQAQDGNSTNNSSFASTPDGTSPRMRIGLFKYGSTTATDYTDADYDGTVVIHEYTHGVTNRIVGGGTETSCLSGVQSGAMGEGWSDYFAISYFNDPLVGVYVALEPYTGIRRNSYYRYPYTYEDLGNDGFEVHNDGEIWAATLWDLRTQLGAAVTDKLVLNGLRFTPCRPSMVNARDGIITADTNLNGGANRAVLWQVFARHGLGRSAGGVDGFKRQGTVFTAAYNLPADLAPGNQSPELVNKPISSPALGSTFDYTINASDPDGGSLSYSLIKGPDGMTVDSSTGRVTWAAGFVGGPVQIAVSDGQGGRVVHGFTLLVNTPLSSDQPIAVTGLERTTGFATIEVPEGALALQVSLRSGAGDADLYVSDPNGVYVAISVRTGNTETLTWPSPKAGTWGVEVQGYRNYSNVQLRAVIPTPTPIPFPGTLTGLSGDFTSETYYKVSVPAGETGIVIKTSGGTGDLDMYARKDAAPACSSSTLVIDPCVFDSRSTASGTGESITIDTPAATDVYIDLKGFQDYANVTLEVSRKP